MISRRSFLALTGGVVVLRSRLWAADMVPSNLDHILLGVSDLDAGIAWAEQRTGVRAAFGGVHPGRGSRNALLSLGPRRYLEIIAPDPDQPGKGSYDQLKAMAEPRIFNWAVHTDDIAALVRKASAAGVGISEPRAGSRARPDGKILHWQTAGLQDDAGGLLPFFIEWGKDSAHPSVDAPTGCTLKQFSIESPAAPNVAKTCKLLGIDAEVVSGPTPRLRAAISGAKGDVELVGY